MTDKEKKMQDLRTKIKAEIETAKKSKNFGLVAELLKEEAALAKVITDEMLSNMI